MLVVDGVELVAVHQPGQVGELDGHHPARPSSRAIPARSC